MFKKLLNVGKGHSIDKLQQHQHQANSSQTLGQEKQQTAKSQFQLNEIKSYGFSQLTCLGYSSSLSLLAVGSKSGLIRVLGNPAVEFSYQLEPATQIRQIEFIDCRTPDKPNGKASKSKNAKNNTSNEKENQKPSSKDESNIPSKIVVLTDQGQLHLLELKTVKKPNFADNTTQTDSDATNDCSRQQEKCQSDTKHVDVACEYTLLDYVGQVDYFKNRLDGDDRSRRVTTLEISADLKTIFVGTEGGNVYLIPLSAFNSSFNDQLGQSAVDHPQEVAKSAGVVGDAFPDSSAAEDVALSLSVEHQVNDLGANDDEPDSNEPAEPFEMIVFESDVMNQLGEDIKLKKPGAIESLKRHPASGNKILLSYHRGLTVIYDYISKSVDKYFYHNQVLESSCFADQTGDTFYTSHNDGSYIKWDCRQGSQIKANEDLISQLYGPYPCKPTPKIQACAGLVNDQLEEMIIFSGGMPRATYDDKNPVTVVQVESDGKDTIKSVLDFTSKILDFVVITRPRGNIGAASKSGLSSDGPTGTGKKSKQKQQQLQQQRNTPVAVALAILAEEEFAVIDLLNSEYLEFALPYLNCVHSSAITCNQHYSGINEQLYKRLVSHNKQQLSGKLSQNEWPITGGKVIEAPEGRSHDILLTGHEDGSVNIWDVSDLSMKHLIHLPTARYFLTNEDDLPPIEEIGNSPSKQQEARNKDFKSSDGDEEKSSTWPPLKRVGKFDPYSDDARLAIRKLTLCPKTGTMILAGTGGQVLAFKLNDDSSELESLAPVEIPVVSDHRFVWKGHERLNLKPGPHKHSAGYQLTSSVQLIPPVAATSIDLHSDWNLFAIGTSYGFTLFDYEHHHAVVTKCTLNVSDFAIISGDAPGTMSRKKSFRKSLRESFRRLRRGRSQRHQNPISAETTSVPKMPFSRPTTGVRTLNSAGSASPPPPPEFAHRNIFSGERQVEAKVEPSSIVRCVSMTLAVITANQPPIFRPTLWVGTNSGQVLVYAITLADELEHHSEQSQSTDANQQTQNQKPMTTAKLAKEIQLKHRAPIIAIFTSPEAPKPYPTPEEEFATLEKSASFESSAGSSNTDRKSPDLNEASTSQVSNKAHLAGSPAKIALGSKLVDQQARVLICSEEQFKVFNLPSLKPFCKFKLTAHEGLRARKINITQLPRPPLLKGSAQMKSSKSSQSFATQTSRPITPSTCPDQEGGQITKSGENNNNLVTTLNNNHAGDSAKFGSKISSQTSPNIAGDLDDSDANEGLYEPYMVCMSNQGDCAIYSVPDLKRQAQIQVCRREDVNGITSTMLTNYGEGYYLRSSSNFLRFSISNQRVPRVLSVV